MYIYEVPLLEELMNGVCCKASDLEDCLEGICSGTQMRNCTKILHRMSLLLKRIVRGALTLNCNLLCLQLEWLLSIRGSNKLSLCDDCCSYIDGA